MQYMLMIFGEETPENQGPEPGTAAFQAYIQPWADYSEALVKAGVMVSGEPLEPSVTATCVQHRDGKRVVQDGPFVDSKDQLGGFYIIDVDTLDEAIAWAEKCPGAKMGTMEVRAIMNIPGLE